MVFQPQFVYGSTDKTGSVQMSAETARHDSPASSGGTAKEVLLRVQKDSDGSDKQSTNHWRDTLTDKDLLRKGIVIEDTGNYKHENQTLDSNHDTNVSKKGAQSSMYFNDSAAEESMLCLNNLLALNSENDPLRSPSPDSSFSDTPNSLRLPTSNFRSRSSTSETTNSTASTRRTSPSSGIPSSIWSGRESALELVQEEDGIDEDFEDERFRDERAISSNSDSSDRLVPSGSPSKEEDEFTSRDTGPTHFYHPDEETLIQTVPRRGIYRSKSIEAKTECNISDASLSTTVEVENVKTRRSSAGRTRSHSFFNKG